MVKRKKRLERGIASIEKQIKVHEEKRAQALEEGEIERADYYEKEILGLKKSKKKKEDIVNKQ